MKTNYNLYLGTYLYFATGEGLHSYLLLIQTRNKTEALNKFVDSVMSKYSCADLSKRAHFEAGCSVTEISKVKSSNFAKPYDKIIESVQALCQQGGMGGGYFELMFRYNLS